MLFTVAIYFLYSLFYCGMGSPLLGDMMIDSEKLMKLIDDEIAYAKGESEFNSISRSVPWNVFYLKLIRLKDRIERECKSD